MQYFVIYIFHRKLSICFALLCLVYLCNNLSFIYRKFPIRFVLFFFLSNSCYKLSYILYRKFPIYFALLFWLIYAIISLVYYIGNFLYVLCCFFSQLYAIICRIYYVENFLCLVSVFSAILNHIFV